MFPFKLRTKISQEISKFIAVFKAEQHSLSICCWFFVIVPSMGVKEDTSPSVKLAICQMSSSVHHGEDKQHLRYYMHYIEAQ